jgi:histidinol-phosphate aminotransferase
MNIAKKNVLEIKPYVPGKPIAELIRELGLTEVIKLASNENPLGPSPKAIQAIKKEINEIHRYPESTSPPLRNELAKRLNVSPDSIILGNGSNEIIVLIAEAFLDSSEEVIMADPSFVVYPIAAQMMGAKLIKVPLKNYVHDLETMANLCTSKTKIIFICNPNNPTGTIVTKEEVEKFISKIPKHTLIIFDEAYFEYVESASYPNGIDYINQGNVIVLRSFSKIYGLAGLRIGYGVSTPEIIEVLNRIRQPFNVNHLAIQAALAALTDVKHVAESIKMNSLGKQYLYSLFEELNIEYVPTYANFIYVDFKNDVNRIYNMLLEEGVIIRPVSQTAARITIGKPEENQKLANALKKVLSKIS